MKNRDKLSEPDFAFPCSETSKFHNMGMTLREYYAAKAMAAMISRGGYIDAQYIKKLTEDAFKIADSMIEYGG